MTDHPTITEMLHKLIDERHALGLAHYGVPLTPFNGRSAITDAIEELIDLLAYLLQEDYERRHLMDEAEQAFYAWELGTPLANIPYYKHGIYAWLAGAEWAAGILHNK